MMNIDSFVIVYRGKWTLPQFRRKSGHIDNVRKVPKGSTGGWGFNHHRHVVGLVYFRHHTDAWLEPGRRQSQKLREFEDTNRGDDIIITGPHIRHDIHAKDV